MNQAAVRQQPDVEEVETLRLAILGDVTLSYVIVLRQSPFFYVKGDDGKPHWTTDQNAATKFGTSEAANLERRQQLGIFRAVVQGWLERPDNQELVVWNEEEK